jgi:hypothetical protein
VYRNNIRNTQPRPKRRLAVALQGVANPTHHSSFITEFHLNLGPLPRTRIESRHKTSADVNPSSRK